jgi:hypothetical protein
MGSIYNGSTANFAGDPTWPSDSQIIADINNPPPADPSQASKASGKTLSDIGSILVKIPLSTVGLGIELLTTPTPAGSLGPSRYKINGKNMYLSSNTNPEFGNQGSGFWVVQGDKVIGQAMGTAHAGVYMLADTDGEPWTLPDSKANAIVLNTVDTHSWDGNRYKTEGIPVAIHSDHEAEIYSEGAKEHWGDSRIKTAIALEEASVSRGDTKQKLQCANIGIWVSEDQSHWSQNARDYQFSITKHSGQDFQVFAPWLPGGSFRADGCADLSGHIQLQEAKSVDVSGKSVNEKIDQPWVKGGAAAITQGQNLVKARSIYGGSTGYYVQTPVGQKAYQNLFNNAPLNPVRIQVQYRPMLKTP